MGQNDVRCERSQFRRVPAGFYGIGSGPARIDPHVAANGPTQSRQLLQERPDPRLISRIVRSRIQEYGDASHPLALLRAYRERPCRRHAAEQRDEVPALHSITSSARASSIGGTSRPSALAVLRFSTSSNLVACSTG